MSFVVSGTFDGITRDRVEDFINSKGGSVKSAVSGKTSYLIVGSLMEDGREITQGGKYKKAKDKGIPILTELEFEAFIQRKTGLKDFQFCQRDKIL